MDKPKTLLLGAGYSREKKIQVNNNQEWVGELVTCDINDRCKPDVVWNLEFTPWPFKENEFDEIHAYEVLEHFGQQGDWKAFFRHFNEIWRILKPGGYLCATVPHYTSRWAWGDPGHTRIIQPETLVFLEQEFYTQDGNTPQSDYLTALKPANFRRIYVRKVGPEEGTTLQTMFVLQAIKE